MIPGRSERPKHECALKAAPDCPANGLYDVPYPEATSKDKRKACGRCLGFLARKAWAETQSAQRVELEVSDSDIEEHFSDDAIEAHRLATEKPASDKNQ